MTIRRNKDYRDNGRIEALELLHCPVTEKTTWSFIKLRLSDGMTGWGEASWVRHPAALDVYHALARERLLGQDWTGLTEYLSGDTVTLQQAAIWSALDQAMWDIRGQRRGCPSSALTGSLHHECVPLYANINRSITDRSEPGFMLAGQKAVAAGFNRIKIAPFDGLTPENLRSPQGVKLMELGLSRVAATRAGIGAADLYVDCHWRFDAQSASAVMKELSALGVSWFECPLPETSENIPALKRLRGQANGLGMRLAGLEELISPALFTPWLAAGAYDVVMPDVKYARGISGVLAVASLAAAYGIGCAPHNPSGPICHAASLVACAVSETIDLLEHQFDETPAFWQMIDDDFPRPRNGESLLPSAWGLGTPLRLPPV
ncbi:enolase C-terminal domain-like protein [Sodalis sp. dw_96]|uniref:enolase C-terminal domain-like protein n=1 Tax=Sodalis sp. dw_96 TaxID=2719794 RepID=UPI001BD2A87C|nr:enolase C-terminal domain-like protein [Sodalis sp. dw_96]